jgi:hypothetical protein
MAEFGVSDEEMDQELEIFAAYSNSIPWFYFVSILFFNASFILLKFASTLPFINGRAR